MALGKVPRKVPSIPSDPNLGGPIPLPCSPRPSSWHLLSHKFPFTWKKDFPQDAQSEGLEGYSRCWSLLCVAFAGRTMKSWRVCWRHDKWEEGNQLRAWVPQLLGSAFASQPCVTVGRFPAVLVSSSVHGDDNATHLPMVLKDFGQWCLAFRPLLGPVSTQLPWGLLQYRAVVLKAFSLRTPLHLKIIEDPKSFYLCGF